MDVSHSTDIVSLAREAENHKATQKSLEVSLKSKEVQIKELKETRNLLEELRTVNAMTVRKMEMADPNRVVRSALNPETAARISQLDNEIRAEENEKKRLMNQRDTMNRLLDTKERALNDVHKRLKDIKDLTGWDARTQKSRDDFLDTENRTLELKKRLTELQNEQITMKNITQTKTKVIEELAGKLEAQKEIEDELFQAQTTLKMKERELEDARDDLRTLIRIAQKKNRMLDQMKADDDQKRIRAFENQKKVLQHEITKTLDSRRTNDRTILAQQSKIDQLTEKLTVIANVLRSQKTQALSPEEHSAFRPGVDVGVDSVPSNLFEDVQRELNDMRATLAERESQLTELDANIESVERKVSILSKAKDATSKRHVLDSRDVALEAAQLEAYLSLRQESYEQQLDQLQRENQKLERDLGRLAK